MGYHDHDGVTEALYPICCRVIKHGDELTIDLTGTAPQVSPGSINCARPAMEGAVLGVILTYLCYDLPWSIAGLRRIVRIVSEEGTLNNAVSPAGTSFGSTMATLSTQDVVAQAFAKMMLCSEKYRDEAHANWTPGCDGTFLIAPNPDAEPSVGAITDFFCGGGGARTFQDGIDSGGIFHSMASRLANAETVESRVPVLQVYRRELPDAGGPGRFRGGVSVEFASMPHKMPIRPGGLNQVGSGVALPAGRGLAGGGPGAASSNVVLRGSDLAPAVRRRAACRRRPRRSAHRPSTCCRPRRSSMLDEGDVLIGSIGNGAGYGDPLRREPAAVARDVADGLVSPEIAGVGVRGGVRRRRRRRRGHRAPAAGDPRRAAGPAHALEGAAGGDTLDGGDVLHPVGDTVEAVLVDGERSLRCSLCHHRYGPYDHDHKRSAVMRELPLTAISPHNVRCLPEFVLREFYCPGCATTVAVDVQRTEEPILDETRLSAGSDAS